MKTPFLKHYLEHVQEILKALVIRFPLQIVIIAVMATLFFTLNHIGYDSELETSLIKGVLSCIVTFFLSLGFAITAESMSLSYGKSAGLKVLALLSGAGFFYLLSDLGSASDAVLSISTIIGVIAYVFFAPYVNNKVDSEQYYSYFYNTSAAFVFAMIIGILLFILGEIALQAINLLFDVFHQDDIYGDWAIIALSIFAPLAGLSYIPSKESFMQQKYHIPTFVSFIIKYIGISFVCIYFLILYAYSIKVLMNFNQRPQGEVSWLVIGFSIGGYLVYAYSSAFAQENVLVALFRKVLPYAVSPQLLMLFYAIYLRINQYGLTINRYLVVIFGVFLVIVSCYYIFSKTKSLKTLPLTLASLIVFMSVGPRSIYALPVADQLHKLEAKLVETKLLQDNVIVPMSNDMPLDQITQDQIFDIIRYLCDYHKCSAMKDLFPSIDYNVTDARYMPQQTIGELLNISYVGRWRGEADQQYFLQGKDLFSSLPLDIAGFSTIITINTVENTQSDMGLQAVVDVKNQKLVLMQDKNEIDSIDISDIFEQIFALKLQPGWTEYDKGLHFDIQPAGHRLVISHMNYSLHKENETTEIDPNTFSINGYLLMK